MSSVFPFDSGQTHLNLQKGNDRACLCKQVMKNIYIKTNLYQYEVFPTQVSKSVEILDRSLVLHEKNVKKTSKGARYSCPAERNCTYLQPEKKRSGSSKVLMNMELVEGKN